MSVMKSRGVAVLVSGAGLLSLALGCDGVKGSKSIKLVRVRAVPESELKKGSKK